MKGLQLLFLAVIFNTVCISGQDVPGIRKSRVKYLSIGFTAGAASSVLYANEDWYTTPHYLDESIAFIKQNSSGLFLGALFDINYSKHFTLQFDASYKRSDHKIEYDLWSQKGSVGTSTESVYDIEYSNLYFSAVPRFSFGDTLAFILFAGPVIDVPFNADKSAVYDYSSYNFVTKTGSSYTTTIDPSSDPAISGGIGIVYGLGIELPVHSSFLSLEFRGMLKPYKLIKDPPVIERVYILTLTYRFRIRNS